MRNMDIFQLKEVGVNLGFEGDDLKKFVGEQQELARQQRHAEREATRANEEAARASEEAARASEEAARVHEELKMKHERDMYESHAKLEASRRESIVSETDTPAVRSRASRSPKLPCFDQQRDDIDDYLMRYERYSEMQGWDRDDYALNLGALLTGKALEVYSRLPLQEANDYEKLKLALLTHFQLTCDDFRKKFNLSRPSSSESATQFLSRLTHFLDRWISLSGVEKTFEGIRDMILKEQFLNAIPRDLAIFIKENAPKDLVEVADLAKKYTLARATGNPRDMSRNRQPVVSITPQRIPVAGPNNKRSLNRRACYICDHVGHFANACPQGNPRANGNWSTNRDRQTPRRNSMGNAKPDNSQNKPHTANVSIEVGDNTIHNCSVEHANATSGCSCCVPMVDTSFMQAWPNLPVYDGYVEDTPVKVLRDTGCSSVIVRKSLINPSDFTGKQKSMMMVDRTIIRVPTARCHITTPMFTGVIDEALCLDNPICELIIGNIVGVRDTETTSKIAKRSQLSLFEHEHDSMLNLDMLENSVLNNSLEIHKGKAEVSVVNIDNANQVAAVVTRKQAKRLAKPHKALAVPTVVDTGISADQFKAMQKEDVTLNKCFKLAEREVVDTKKPLSHWYREEKGTLFRYFR